ncbi:hypothetical protein IGI04_019471 [Brassica rapa subsp. trilocularis]|uniref:Uncharacterized protein n=1 Tax=Brassica rapa subsp. trilocularis TaxID=1813537 RepID=A0ABQ7MFX8_BRACM|nr:hypothetical protein IGI04_019471 [Brassica rapa subsp. trilocularis]
MGTIGQGLSPFSHLHPFALSDWPTALSKDPTAHGLMAGPHSPPLTRTRTISLKPKHYRLTRLSRLFALIGLSLSFLMS